uniref:Uncharacterized protein n=1 Tax=Lotus japonicus TaxID=34305 RepID=I3T2C1_LOTJA|nr:unknown [Lotus japonicus]
MSICKLIHIYMYLHQTYEGDFQGFGGSVFSTSATGSTGFSSSLAAGGASATTGSAGFSSSLGGSDSTFSVVSSVRCHARPCSFRASRNLLCSSSVHRSLCFVIVYGFLVLTITSSLEESAASISGREQLAASAASDLHGRRAYTTNTSFHFFVMRNTVETEQKNLQVW